MPEREWTDLDWPSVHAVEGDASYALYEKEKADILASLKRRSGKLVDGLNKLTGVTCNNSDGAMYAFPNLTFSEKFLKDCEGKGRWQMPCIA